VRPKVAVGARRSNRTPKPRDKKTTEEKGGEKKFRCPQSKFTVQRGKYTDGEIKQIKLECW